MNVIRFITCFCALCISQYVLACSCFNIPCAFFDNEFASTEHVLHVRVIGSGEMIDDSRYARMNSKLTRLAVLRRFSENSIADTILFYHGDGAMCFHGLPNETIGQEFILKLSGLGAADRYPNIFRMQLCSRPWLSVQGQKVIGHITKNRRCKKLQQALKRNELLSDEDKIDLNALYGKPNARNQRKSIKRFGKIWNRYKEAKS